MTTPLCPTCHQPATEIVQEIVEGAQRSYLLRDGSGHTFGATIEGEALRLDAPESAAPSAPPDGEFVVAPPAESVS